jgi:uncharacterized membrane protein
MSSTNVVPLCLEVEREKRMSRQKRFAYIIVFLALSMVGAALKIPIGLTSIALDSAPALLAAITLGPIAGAVVGGIGHILSAFLGGLPLGSFHFLITIEMGLIMYLFGYLSQRRLTTIGFGFFVLCNTVIAPIPFYFLLSPAFYWTTLFPLFIGSVCNSGMAAVVSRPLQNYLKKSGSIA